MTRSMARQYTKLIEFMSRILGPDYEIVVYDIAHPKNAIIAIVNGHITGRTVGEAIDEIAWSFVKNKIYEKEDYCINYRGQDNTRLRSSSFFLKDENQKLIGILNITFDDIRYHELSTQVLQLCHPDHFVANTLQVAPFEKMDEENYENFRDSASELISRALHKLQEDNPIPVDRMTQREKIHLIRILNDQGVFELKGAVQEVAKKLKCSQASVYRYCSQLK